VDESACALVDLHERGSRVGDLRRVLGVELLLAHDADGRLTIVRRRCDDEVLTGMLGSDRRVIVDASGKEVDEVELGLANLDCKQSSSYSVFVLGVVPGLITLSHQARHRSVRDAPDGWLRTTELLAKSRSLDLGTFVDLFVVAVLMSVEHACTHG
jgi:hypothetical protein